MKFRLLAHAALWIECGETSALLDPWLQGSAYDGAWALLPEPSTSLVPSARPDWVVYSHGHPDHFHFPTLDALVTRFGRDLKFLVPRQIVGSLADTLRARGLRRVYEARACQPVALGNGLTITFYPLRANDSVQIVQTGGHTLINANDCEIDDTVLRHLARQWPRCDFYLGQFSIGDGYPFRLHGLAESVLAAAALQPLARFRRQAKGLAARYAIPSAALFRFAHADNQHMNRWLTPLDDVRAPLEDFEPLTILYPGDGFDERSGFVREPTHRARYENAVTALRAGALPCTARGPAPTRASLEAAAAERFADMFARIPAPLRRRMKPLGFYLEDAACSVTVDWSARTLRWADVPPAVPHYRLAASHFLGVCRSRWGWCDFHIAARFSVHGWRHETAIQFFLPLSILYGLGYFSCGWRHYLRLRSFVDAWDRRVEIAAVVRRAARHSAFDDGPVPRL